MEKKDVNLVKEFYSDLFLASFFTRLLYCIGILLFGFLLFIVALISLDLSELLQLMAKQYNDLDVRDRARFYHQLMLTVSGDKVSNI